MVIKSGKIAWEGFCILLFCILVPQIALIYEVESADKNLLSFVYVGFIPAYVMLFNYWLSMGRTLIVDEYGCTVKLLWFSKFYLWNDFKVKQIEEYNSAIGMRSSYLRGAIFSEREVKRWTNVHPEYRSMFLNPLSLIYVKFRDQRPRPQDILDFYIVDETLFREKMAEWGIALDEVVI